MAKQFQSPKLMLDWQYRSMLEELTELQRHASDPTCPCTQSDTGEFCLPKHSLGLHTLAAETASMDAVHHDLLESLAEEALEQHNALKDRITCAKPHKDERDTVQWARQWRKKLEDIYYYANCPRQRPSKAELAHYHLSDPGLTVANVADHTRFPQHTERVVVAFTDPHGKVIARSTVSEGNAHTAPLPVSKILHQAQAHGAAGLVIMHNHPSGTLAVSKDDVTATRILCKAAAQEGIRCIDHKIIGDGVTGFVEKGLSLSEPPDVRVTGCRSAKTCIMNRNAREAFRESAVNPKEAPATIAAIEKELQFGRGRKRGSPETFAIGPKTLTRYEMRYRIVDASELIVSHDPFTFSENPDYPQELQPRLRERAATQLQVINMAAGINPDVLLVEFHSIDRGAPIVGHDNIVESGNGRVMSLKRAVKDHPESYSWYKASLEMALSEYGIPLADFKGVEHPVLVRERLTDVNRKDFAEEANASTTIALSSIEQARSDGKLVSLTDLNNLDVAEGQSIQEALRGSRNSAFVKSFIAKLPQNEQARLMDADGRLNQEGVRRLVLALFVVALPGESGLKLAEKFFESVDDTVRNVLNGITLALGKLASAESLAQSGQRDKGLAVGDDLARTVAVFASIKATPGMTVEKYLAQGQLGERQLTAFQEGLLSEIASRARSGKSIGELLGNYAQAVIDSPPPQQAGMFGGVALSKKGILDAAGKKEAPMLAQPKPPKEPDVNDNELDDADIYTPAEQEA